jgi:hypothetical protein
MPLLGYDSTHAHDTEKSPLLGNDDAHVPLRPRSRLLQSSTIIKLVFIAAFAWLAMSSRNRGDEIQQDDSFEPVTWSTEPFNPTSIPLAARSPYLNVWLEGGNRARRGLLTSQFGRLTALYSRKP